MIDVELYGGKEGLLAHIRSRALYALGAYRNLRDVDWASVRRLAFICKGNICRSAYASARASSLGASAASFGLEAAQGLPADPAALRNAQARGVDLSMHRSARMESSCIRSGDLIVVFEPWQIPEACLRGGGQVPVTLLGIWARPVHPHVQDPYGRSDRYFQRCFSLIDSNVGQIVERIASKLPVAGRTPL